MHFLVTIMKWLQVTRMPVYVKIFINCRKMSLFLAGLVQLLSDIKDWSRNSSELSVPPVNVEKMSNVNETLNLDGTF